MKTALRRSFAANRLRDAGGRRRLSRAEMRVVLTIERDLEDRRQLGFHRVDADVRRDIRETWKAIVTLCMTDGAGDRAEESDYDIAPQ